MKHVTIQQKGLIAALNEKGWELASLEGLHEWWADEVWRIRSTWSPQGRELYLTFLVDPMAEGPRKKGQDVIAVKASAALPTQRVAAEGEFEMYLGHGWAERLDAFVSELSCFRDRPPSPQ